MRDVHQQARLTARWNHADQSLNGPTSIRLQRERETLIIEETNYKRKVNHHLFFFFFLTTLFEHWKQRKLLCKIKELTPLFPYRIFLGFLFCLARIAGISLRISQNWNHSNWKITKIIRWIRFRFRSTFWNWISSFSSTQTNDWRYCSSTTGGNGST